MWLLGLPCKTPIQSPPLRPQGHIILICLWAWFLTLDYVGGCWDVGWLCTPCKPPRKCSSEQMFIKKTKQTKTANVNCNWLRRGAGELTTYAHSQNKWSGTQQREMETLSHPSLTCTGGDAELLAGADPSHFPHWHEPNTADHESWFKCCRELQQSHLHCFIGLYTEQQAGIFYSVSPYWMHWLSSTPLLLQQFQVRSSWSDPQHPFYDLQSTKGFQSHKVRL